MTEASSSFHVPFSEDYESEFEYDVDVGEKRKARQDLASNHVEPKVFKPNKQQFHEQCSKEQGYFQQQQYLALDAYTRHKKLVNEYVLCYRGATEKLKRNVANYKTDHDVIRENHRFLWEDEDEAYTWGQQLAKKYYDRLFKEYCLCDLSRYKDKKVGMRWRTEKELILGKGQFFCGNVHCDEKCDLNSWEVMFGYCEHGEKKSALVKLRLCARCSDKLHYGFKGKIGLRKKSKISEGNQDLQQVSTSTESSDSEKKERLSDESSNIWKQALNEETEKSKEDEFEEFLEGLLL